MILEIWNDNLARNPSSASSLIATGPRRKLDARNEARASVQLTRRSSPQDRGRYDSQDAEADRHLRHATKQRASVREGKQSKHAPGFRYGRDKRPELQRMAKIRGTTKDAEGQPVTAIRRKRGRRVEKPMPEPIPDAPEAIAQSIMQGPSKRNCNYLKDNS